MIVNVVDIKSFERGDYCTTWDIKINYGIEKQKTCRYIRAGKLNAIMVGDGRYVRIRWFIKKDRLLDEFIEKHRVDGGAMR